MSSDELIEKRSELVYFLSCFLSVPGEALEEGIANYLERYDSVRVLDLLAEIAAVTSSSLTDREVDEIVRKHCQFDLGGGRQTLRAISSRIEEMTRDLPTIGPDS